MGWEGVGLSEGKVLLGRVCALSSPESTESFRVFCIGGMDGERNLLETPPSSPLAIKLCCSGETRF